MTVVGVLHPGAMGATVGAACTERADVIWCRAGRSDATAARAGAARLGAVDTLADLVARADVIVSVCPPGNAEALATTVAEAAFSGVYVDANAIAPATSRRIALMFEHFVDGGIVGPPAHQPGTTRLYLAGDEAHEVAALWTGSALEPHVLEGPPGAASALKMAYATWTKVSAALLLGVRALARSEGVDEALLAEWARSHPDAEARSVAAARNVGPKAWRWVAEMDEIATAFAAAGLPDGFGQAASDLYSRLAQLKDNDDIDLESLLDLISDRAVNRD